MPTLRLLDSLLTFFTQRGDISAQTELVSLKNEQLYPAVISRDSSFIEKQVQAHLKKLRELHSQNSIVLICEANMSCECLAPEPK